MASILFVDDEPMVLSGLRRTLRGLRAEWEMTFAEGAAAARSILEDRAIDVIVSDLRMPDEDGASLLNHAAAIQPDSIRFVLSGYADRDCILQTVFPAHQFLSKPCEPERLIARLRTAAGIVDPAVAADDRRVIVSSNRLPASAAVCASLQQALEMPMPTAEAIFDIVGQDLGLSIQLLRLAASAFFSTPRPDSSLIDAIDVIGADRMADLLFRANIIDLVEAGDPRHAELVRLNRDVEPDDRMAVLAKLGSLLTLVHGSGPSEPGCLFDAHARKLISLWGFDDELAGDQEGAGLSRVSGDLMAAGA